MDRLAERLRTERERQRLTTRELSAQTKIREQYIHAIEQGQYGVLPSVYVRSFIRTAAQALGIPLAEITVLIEEAFDEENMRRHEPSPRKVEPARTSSMRPAPAPTPSELRPDKPATAPRLKNLAKAPTFSPMMLAMLILAGLAACVLVWSYWSSGSEEQPPADASGTVVNVDPAVGTGTSSLQDTGNGTAAALDSMVLTAVVTDTAWLTITMDGKRTQQLVLLPGTEHTWRAWDKYAISLGNAGGVKFSRDGQELKPFGKKGEAVRSIVITRKDIVSSAMAYRPQPRPANTERPAIMPAPSAPPPRR